MVKQDMSHPSVVSEGEGEVLPIHRFETIRGVRSAEDIINDAESGSYVRITLMALGSHGFVLVQDAFEHSVVVYATSVLALDTDVEESPGAEVSLVLECRFQYGGSG